MVLKETTIVIADDLTGANDTLLQYFKKGAKARILIDIDDKEIFDNEADVWAVTTESRNVDKSLAFERVTLAAKELSSKLNCNNFYKKIDSTLRGNVGVEIFALLDILDKDAAIVAPAYIDEGRSTIGAYQLLNGLPIERTQCALDPKAPIYDSYIPLILTKDITNPQVSSLISTIGLNVVTKGAGPITSKINELIQEGKKIIVLDAASNVDLEQIALAIDKCNYNVLPTGSAGLANAMNKKMGDDIIQNIDFSFENLPRLIVSGSATKLTYNQIQKLKDKKNIFFVDLKVQDIIENKKDEILEEVSSHLFMGDDVVIHSSNIASELEDEKVLSHLIDAAIAKDEFSSKITDYLSELVYLINQKNDFILLMVGGETSYKCAKKINSSYLEILNNILPAVPLCCDKNGRIIITKSGNFGNINTLADILNFFDKLRTNEKNENI